MTSSSSEHNPRKKVLKTEIITFWKQVSAFNELITEKNLNSKSIHWGIRELTGKLHCLKWKFIKKLTEIEGEKIKDMVDISNIYLNIFQEKINSAIYTEHKTLWAQQSHK